MRKKAKKIPSVPINSGQIIPRIVNKLAKERGDD